MMTATLYRFTFEGARGGMAASSSVDDEQPESRLNRQHSQRSVFEYIRWISG
jgi:hypothetical protein